MTEGREAAWRIARWRFLRDCAERFGARVATAHTEDDQVETVLMRTMRGSGARGLVGLLADTDVVRPFLALRRDAIAAYAARVGLRWVEDPSNTSREFFRNRVRHDLLPALRLANAGIDDVLLDVARRAGALRRDIESFVAHLSSQSGKKVTVATARELRLDAANVYLYALCRGVAVGQIDVPTHAAKYTYYSTLVTSLGVTPRPNC